MIRIGDDKVLYEVGGVKEALFIKPFKVIGDMVKISDEDDENFSRGDVVKVSYKEQAVLSILQVRHGGKGYRVGELLSISGGTPSVESLDGTVHKAYLKVEQVDDKGGVQTLSINKQGKYIQTPEQDCELIGGSGNNCLIKVAYKVLEKRALIERTIQKMIRGSSQTIVNFHYPIPKSVTEGKISAQKWEANLTSNYVGETQIGAQYEILRDYTGYLNLPLMARNTNCPELIFNRSLKILDQRIKELEAKLSKLENKD